MDLLPLDPAVKTAWRIAAGLGWGAAALAAAAVDVGLLLGDGPVPPGVLTAGVLAAGGVHLALVPARYRAWAYGLDDDALRVERGVLTRVKTVVPLRRVQHLDVTQGLVEREYGLGTLVVHTAGTRDATVAVPGLPYADAERLRDAVQAHVTDDAV